MMSYLQQDILKEMGLNMFDAWAGNFTEIQHTLELAPEGTGYQQKTRMAKFFNLPEVDIYNYITEGTFDAYMYQLLETKMKFIAQKAKKPKVR